MHNLLKMFGKTIGYVSVFALVCGVAAAENVRTTASSAARNPNDTRGRGTSNAQRMMSIPVLPMSGLGNVSTGKPVNYVSNNAGTDSGITPADPTDNNGDNGNNGGNGNNGNNGDNGNNGNNNGGDFVPAPACDLSYTIDACMADVYACVSGGALPNGIYSMFDSKLRESIIAGMGLCQSQVDYCIANVRLPKNVRDPSNDNNGCVYVYGSAQDVWYDFNARRVQPEYYRYVLRKTGLTPRQAENTCLLLDHNTYGASFNAVNSNRVTSEYANDVWAYNSGAKNIGGVEVRKNSPLGADVAKGATDTDRGYYARWDAQNAQCLVRVAAYNKDRLITNQVLWGVGGDDSPAEIWKSAGETFTCNKDLFGFALKRDTINAAIIAVPTGTALGVGVAAAVDKGREKNSEKLADMCKDEEWRRQLTERLRENKYDVPALRRFLNNHELYTKAASESADGKAPATKWTDGNLTASGPIINDKTCIELVTVHTKYLDAKEALDECVDVAKQWDVKIEDNEIQTLIAVKKLECELPENSKEKKVCDAYKKVMSGRFSSEGELINAIKAQDTSITDNDIKNQIDVQQSKNGLKITALCECEDGAKIKSQEALNALQACRFKNMDYFRQSDKASWCKRIDGDCIGFSDYKRQVEKMEEVYSKIEDLLKVTGKVSKADKAKDMAIGAAIGAAAGGTATLITSFVESSRINCRVGDDLARVDLNKSYTIDSLRDIYVKWALNMPDPVSNSWERSDIDVVTNCGNWDAICGARGGASNADCEAVQVNYLPTGVYTPQLVQNACHLENGNCIINFNTSKRYGIMDADATCPERVTRNEGSGDDNGGGDGNSGTNGGSLPANAQEIPQNYYRE